MLRSPFFPAFDDLPRQLPVFPLSGVIVMPGVDLPLNVFEPRYLNLVEDALKSQHLFGMVQPNLLHPAEPPKLYGAGCVGRITSYSETRDGRIELTLSGLIRFRIVRELDSARGYRRVEPDWRPYAEDLCPDEQRVLRDRNLVTGALKRFLQERNLEIDWQALERVSDVQLVHILATVLPLEAVEKQAILEARDAGERAEALQTALHIGLQSSPSSMRH